MFFHFLYFISRYEINNLQNDRKSIFRFLEIVFIHMKMKYDMDLIWKLNEFLSEEIQTHKIYHQQLLEELKNLKELHQIELL
jgi:hypothetical protein